MDAEDYRSLMETFHLLRSPDNAARLREGMRQHQTGVKKEMMDRIRQIDDIDRLKAIKNAIISVPNVTEFQKIVEN
jgi:hypothetical protein